jgi:hypothetical protein
VRQQNPEQTVSGAKTGTTCTSSPQHGKLMMQDDQFQ